MSDHDTTPDPMDKAYAQAEALLDDEAARAARRARVLAAVAEPAEAPQPAPRRAFWRHGGWLAAASVAGVSVFIATQIDQPDSFERPIAPPQAPAAAPATPIPPAVAPVPAAQPATAQPDRLAKVPPVAARPAAAPSAPRQPSVVAAEPPAARDVEAPPPPPPPPPPVASIERRIAPAPAPPPPRAEAPAAARSRVEEVVVTGSRIERAPLAAFSEGSPGELAERLREAAAAGRTSDVARLLARGAPIDAADDDGETALMKSIQTRKLDAVAFLRRRGASLDLENHAGRSAKDMAAALADPELNKALGLDR